METYDLFLRFGIALAIGFLIGLQREYAEYRQDAEEELFAGARTFAFMGLAGCVAAFAADQLGSAAVFIAVVAALTVWIAVAYFISAWRWGHAGQTTEVAALITVLLGAMCFWGQIALAVAIGVTVTVLLALKFQVRTFVTEISREDVYATLRFAVITAIILPVLPDRSFAPPPFDVLNPHRIWEMVVLISAISFLGYVLIKWIGPRKGIGLTGLLGGVASSTAVTLSFAQRSQERAELSRPFALALVAAWTVMFPRVLVEVAVLNQDLVRVLWAPFLAIAAVAFLYGAYLYTAQPTEEGEEMHFSNPFNLGPAIQFGILYAIILVVSRAAELYFGTAGVYVSSLAGGLADVDAIALSVAQLSRAQGGLDLEVARRAVVLAAIANTASKGTIVLVTGSRGLRRALAPAFILILITGIGVAFLF